MHRHRLYTVALALIAAAALAPGSAHAGDVPRVGVVVALTVNADPDETRPLAVALGEALHTQLLVDVVAGTEVERRLPPAGLPDDCVAEEACWRDVAERLAADQLLLLVFVRVGDRMQIDTTWVDVASGKSASRPAISLGPGDDHAGIFRDAAPRLLPGARRRPKDRPPTVIVTQQPGQRVVVEREPRHVTTGVWIAGSVSAASLAGGLGATLWARSTYRSLEADGCKVMECPERQGDLRSLERRALAADLLVGAAVVSGVTAAVLYWRSGGERQVAVTPAIAPDGAVGVSLGGRF